MILFLISISLSFTIAAESVGFTSSAISNNDDSSMIQNGPELPVTIETAKNTEPQYLIEIKKIAKIKSDDTSLVFAPMQVNEKSILYTDESGVHQIDIEQNKTQNVLPLEDEISTSASIYQNGFWSVGGYNWIYFFDSTNTLVNKVKIKGELKHNPIIVGENRVFSVSENGTISCSDFSGNDIKGIELGSPIFAHPTLSGDGEIILGAADHSILVIDSKKCEVKKKILIKRPIQYAVQKLKQKLNEKELFAVPGLTGDLVIHDETGKALGYFKITDNGDKGTSVFASALFEDGSLLLRYASGEVQAINFSTPLSPKITKMTLGKNLILQEVPLWKNTFALIHDIDGNFILVNSKLEIVAKAKSDESITTKGNPMKDGVFLFGTHHGNAIQVEIKELPRLEIKAATEITLPVQSQAQ